ncbi:dynamin family protein [[Clostridium] leptum]|nr:dynamin family protein [[Clostridium] leptum]
MSLKSEVYSLLNNAQRLCRDCPEAAELSESLEEMRKRLEIPLRVAVVGIMKAGKSTFMNALMGADVLYTGDLETTYTVGWFQYAEHPSITVCFRNGEKIEAPFEDLEKWSVRAFEKENPRIHDVQYLIIHYPSEVLKQLEFIDTPGLNSVYGTDAQNTLDFLSIKGSEDTLYEASMADAVIYAFSRSTAGFDRDILTAFHSGGGNMSSPINSIGILTKVDASGIWDIFGEQSPVEAAQAVTSSIMTNADMKNLLFSVFPVCAKVMEGYTQLTAEDWKVLRIIAQVPPDDLIDLLYDAHQFAVGTEEEFQQLGDTDARKRLMNLIGQYGTLEIAHQLRAGKAQDQIGDILQEKCGVKAIREILLRHFGNRTFLIKSRYIFSRIRSLTQEIRKNLDKSSHLYHVCEQISEEIEGLMSSVQTLKELKILQMYYNGQIQFMDEEEKQDFLRVTGEYGRSAETRLGMPEGSSIAAMEQTAKEKAALWHGKSSGWMMPGSYVEAAATLARSYEQMYYHLNALNEE